MKPLNYSRDVISYVSKADPADPGRPYAEQWIAKLKSAVKFCLPDGGKILKDYKYKALEGIERISLPYDCVALEYSDSRQGIVGMAKPEKHVVLTYQDDDRIYFSSAFVLSREYTRPDGGSIPDGWVLFPECYIPRTGGVDHGSTDKNGDVAIRVWTPQGLPASDVKDEAVTILSLLNALACANVHTLRVEPSALKRAIAKDRGAIPYDTYHVLVINGADVGAHKVGNVGSHRSPREHLRRGHVRRLEDGRRIWINAAVINAGIGASISKDYAMKAVH